MAGSSSGSSRGGGEAMSSPSSSRGKAGGGTPFEYFGWVYHMGVNSVGHEYCHLRFLCLKGKHVQMYKRDPHEDPSAKAIRKGVVSNAFMVEELGRKKVNHGDVYVLRIYSRLDETKKGEIACATPGEAQKWMEAFDQAKQQADFELSQGSSQSRLNIEDEFNLEGHRSRMRPYAADGLKKLIRIGKGPERLLRRSSLLGNKVSSIDRFEGGGPDAIEAHEWKCVRTINGIRIFEDAARQKSSKGITVKAVAVLDANLDSVFEVVCNLDRHQRYQWDVLTGDLELLDSVNGHYDVIYGTYDTNCVTRWWHSKMDFVFSRQWFRAQDGGAYTILQFPANHKKRPPRHGYKRVQINSSIWEIRSLNLLPHPSLHKCLVSHILEVRFSGWEQWKGYSNSKFEKTIPYALLCQVAGLREYFAANPKFTVDHPSTVIHAKVHSVSSSSDEFEDTDLKDEFYDAVSNEEPLDDDDSDEDTDLLKDAKVRLKNVSWAIASLALRKSSSLVVNTELDTSVSPVQVDWSQFHGSMRQGVDASAIDCWTAPSGQGFMIRGKTYLEDYSKVPGGDPLLKLLAVDWFRSDNKIDMIALHPSCIVQSEAAKKLPFILVVHLQIPARPNYSLVLYYGVNRPINKGSLLSRFVNGTDMFRDERFKLIPSVIEGYWMVKRAVGSKACLLGKAVTCKYVRQDNFLEIDVDIGSSSVARSIIGLVLGYVTSIAVDLAILIEAKDESELPEYILGTVRLNRLKPESAVPF